jgi:hypothetical protein
MPGSLLHVGGWIVGVIGGTIFLGCVILFFAEKIPTP